MNETLLKAKDVCATLSISRSTLWRWVGSGAFPAPIQIGAGAVRWRESAVQLWIDGKAI